MLAFEFSSSESEILGGSEPSRSPARLECTALQRVSGGASVLSWDISTC